MRHILLLLLMASLFSCKESKSNKSSKQGKTIKLGDFATDYIISRDLNIYFPPGYKKSAKYPVLYMFDGQMLFDSKQTLNGLEWGVDELLTKLITEKKLPPLIVVGLHSGYERMHAEYFPQKAFALLSPSYQESLLKEGMRDQKQKLFDIPICSDDYLKYVVEEVKPFVDKNCGTLPGREHTYIAGSSMGGLMAMYAFCEYPEVFDAAICMSTHWTGSFEAQDKIPQAFEQYLKENLPPPTDRKIYFDQGTEGLDTLNGGHQLSIDKVLKESGYAAENWMTKTFEGNKHSETDWGKRFEIPLLFVVGEQ